MNETLLDIDVNGGGDQSAQTPDNQTPAAEKAPADGVKPEGGNPRILEFGDEKLEVPDNFWDADKDEINIGALLKSQTDLRKQLEEKPQAPENYELVVPDDLAEIIEADAEDPLAGAAMAWAKENGISQEQFSELTAAFYKIQADSFENPVERKAAELADLQKEWGASTDKKMKDVSSWVSGLLKPAIEKNNGLFTPLQNLVTSADGVRLLAALRDSIGDVQLPGSKTLTPASGVKTEAELAALQADPKYWRDHDPAIIKEVEEGWKALYPD
jgi:hypothetical protein